MFSSTRLLIVTVLAGLALYIYRKVTTSYRMRSLPPGPKPLPFVGNMLDMPMSGEYKTYTQWGKEYGDVVYVSVLGNRMLILNSIKAANELLDQRSSIYSDRPYIPMLHDPDLMDSNWTFAFGRYAATWKRQRRIFTQHLNPNAARAFFNKQVTTTHNLLKALLATPTELEAHIRHAAVKVIMDITYGYNIKPDHDPFIDLAERMSKCVGEGTRPSLFMVNMFPLLKYVPLWFPGAGFKRFAAEAKKAGQDSVQVPYEALKMRIAKGTASPSFVANALTEISDDSPPELTRDILEVAATMYGAATDTTVSTLHSCILALILNPSLQSRAQAELDTVIGAPTSSSFRLPTFADRSDLPYIEAILKESLRWMPVVALGIPHATTEEDVYRGWRIPKGTLVIANAWAILHDEVIYPDPFVFRPERFLECEGKECELEPALSGAFGFGRRVCPGRYLAENTLWLEISSLLAVFNFDLAKDNEGREMDIRYAAAPEAAFLLHPRPFTCSIRPRSKEAEARIHEATLSGVL